MAISRWSMALLGLLGSIGLSAGLWVHFGTPVFFLFLPFVPFVLHRSLSGRSQPHYRCPTCDFQTTDDRYAYCPHDGTRLQEENGVSVGNP